MATRQATTAIGHYNLCPYCGSPDLFPLSASWPHRKCRSCSAVFSDSRPIVAVPVFIHRKHAYAGIRGTGFRKGFLNIPGGYVEEHNDPDLVAAAVTNPGLQLGFNNIVDGESIADAAFAEFCEETGYVGPPVKARIYTDRFATPVHERIVFVIMVVANSEDEDADPTDWFKPSAVQTPGELNDGRWVPLDNLAPAEDWAFPIFYDVLANLDMDPFPLHPRNVRTYPTTAD